MDLSRHEGEIPFPLPITSKYVGGGEQEKPHHARNFHVHHPIAATNTNEKEKENENEIPNNNNNNNSSNCSSGEKGGGRGGAPAVKYRECLKNHAASIGGNATDGCGEFMPSGEDGTMEALKCSACNCHRNFHRKEVDGGGGDQSPLELFHFLHHQQPGRKVVGQKGILINNSLQFPISSPHQMIMPVAAAGGEYSEEMDGGFTAAHRLATPLTKKRFRTKFTPEQKEKMLRFAERIGWRLQKQEEGVVQQFCQEIGVKRRVLKVWMHNNKHNLAKKNSVSISISPAPANFTGLPESLRGVD